MSIPAVRNLAACMVMQTNLVMSLVLLSYLLASPAHAQSGEYRSLTGGWDEFPPYSYLESSDGITRWEGLDVELVREISRRAGYFILAEREEWSSIVDGIRTGKVDFAPHSTMTAERTEYAYFSIPYRLETTALTLRRDQNLVGDVTDAASMVSAFRETKFKLGLRPGVTVQSAELRDFITNPGYEGAISRMKMRELINATLDGDIDGFLSDRILAAHFIETFGAGSVLHEHPFLVHGDLRFMFSKATIPQETVERFNEAIADVHNDGTYWRLNSRYSFPVLVRLSLDTRWFQAVDIIGTIAFALSGLLLAIRFNYDVFGALVLASLPAVGGGIVRDVVSNRSELAVISSPIYVILILVLVVGGYFGLRVGRTLRDRFLGRLNEAQIAFRSRFVSNLVQFCDAVGLAAFTVTGVVIALITHSTPLWIWGPIFAAITAAGGGILRDVTRSDPEVPFLKGELYPEIALAWGFFLSVFLIWEARFLDVGDIRLSITVTFLGALITRLLVIWLGWKSPRFSAQDRVV